MSKWKPISELPDDPDVNGFLFRKKEVVVKGWKAVSGAFYRCPEDDSKDYIIDAVRIDDPDEWRHLPKKKLKPSKWVRLEDGKPEDGNYLCFRKDDAVYDAWYVGERDEWHTDGKYQILDNVTHWRPMPKGPKDNE